MFARRIPPQISAVRRDANQATPRSADRVQARTRAGRCRVKVASVKSVEEKMKTPTHTHRGRDIMPAAMKSIQEGLVQLPFEVRADCECVYVCVSLRFSVCFCLSHFNMNTLSSIDLHAHQSHATAFKGLT